MTSHRFLFYAPEADPGAGSVTITGDEHHHLSRVLRMKAGSEVRVTNGAGWIARCRVETTDSDATTVAVVADESPRRRPDIVLALALIRKERFTQALEQCVELGVTRVIPFVARDTHVRRYGDGTMARMRRVAVSAMKQSFRANLTEIDGPVTFSALVDLVPTWERALVGAPGASRPGPEASSTLVVVGPEAGLCDEEREALAAAGVIPAAVSPHRLRSETAAVALVAAVAHPD